MLTFLLFSLLLAPVLASSPFLNLQLSTGRIEGKVLNSTYSPFGNQTANVFFGIPYATPPLGDLRFRKPRPHATWQGILETKEYKPACLSNPVKTYKTDAGGPVSEDCLYLNVFTNDYCMQNKNCSVMMAVHGGGFLFESSSAFNPEILINNFVGQDRNIVVVSFNYRLGVFGFGQFHGDRDASFDHNVGLFDILLAVKWVRKEIGQFGGRKDRITIAGHSAGAALCFLFSSSPMSKGLIHQQIIMSGPLPNYSTKTNFKASTAVAQRLGCLSEDFGFSKIPKPVMEMTLSCLRNLSGEAVLDAQLYILQNSTYYFGAPAVDGEFILDYPDRMFIQKSVNPINTLLGTTTAELRESKYLDDLEDTQNKTALLINLCEHIGYEVYLEPEEFAEKCQKFYGNGSDSQFQSDDMEFYLGAVNIANAHASKSTKVFLYSYGYSGAGKAFNKYMPTVPSPHHSEDLIYVFGTHRGVMSPKDYVIEKIYSGVFADFVNFGDPSPSESQKWLQYTPENREYFEIDFDDNFKMPGMKSNYYPRAVEFWSSPQFKKHYRDRWSPSLDTFTITNLVAPIRSHLEQVSSAVDKLLESTEKLFYEREQFLSELKKSSKLTETVHKGQEKAKFLRTGKTETDEGEGGVNILLVIFAGTLLVGILYITISHCCLHHRSREGYQLLKGSTI